VSEDLRRSSHFSSKNYIRPHGVGLRGLDVPRGSEQFEGRFGRMFRTLMAAEHNQAELAALATAMVAELEDPPTPETEEDDEENFDIPAGYTYFGQFIDHDLTFDPASSLQKQNDPDGLTDFRTPRFDLDCVYGRGPDDQPYLYDGPIRMLLGNKLNLNPGGTQAFDLPRNTNGRALIGDPRNDENTIVSQLQGIFLRFHNRVADLMPGRPFAEVQQAVRWHYQWAVLHDFLPTIIGQNVVDDILPHSGHKSIKEESPHIFFFHWRDAPFMPVEFSVAAYRFGHSMIRPIYRLNRRIDRIPIFAGKEPNLRGFRPMNIEWAIEWELFFPIRASAPQLGIDRLQPAYKIDSSLVNPLGALPPEIAVDPSSLALRNLKRGLSMGLPSGQRVARYMGLEPLDVNHLKVGKAPDEKTNPRIVDLKVTGDPNTFEDNAPLWYYILAEAQSKHGGKRMGPVGARIIGEVFAGLIAGDNHSYLSQDPTWRPAKELCRDGKTFKIADLIVAATKT
jgi:heme peroxidase